MSEYAPKSNERLDSERLAKRRSSERLPSAERAQTNQEKLNNREVQSSARKEVEAAHEGLEQDRPLELMSDDEQVDSHVRITKEDKQRSYTHTMRHVQRKLSRPSRAFSRVIHNRAVESTSEVLGSTVARPSAMLGGTLFATVGLAVMTYFARRNGFALSGSELALFLAAGWTLGLISELVWRKLIKRS